MGICFIKIEQKMPLLRFKSVDQDKLVAISTKLVDELVEIVGSPRDYFSLEHIPSTFIMDGRIVKTNPIVEVAWFARTQEMQDKVAQCITNHLIKAGYLTVDVYFVKLKRERYYENGEHF